MKPEEKEYKEHIALIKRNLKRLKEIDDECCRRLSRNIAQSYAERYCIKKKQSKEKS